MSRKMPKVNGTAIVLFLTAFILSGFMLAPVLNCKAQAETTLKLVTFQPANFLLNHHLYAFIDRVNKRAAGKVKIEFVGGPEVVHPFENVKMVSKGAFDLAHNTPAYYAGLVPEVLSCYLAVDPYTPMRELDYNPLTKMREIGYFSYMDEFHRKKAGITLLGPLWGGEDFALYSTKPFDSVASFKGSRIRFVPMFDGFIKGLDAKAVTLTNPETYTALQRGVVDAAPIPQGHLAYDTRLYEVTKYIIYPPIPYLGQTWLVANAKKWDSLPEDVRKLIKNVLIEMEPELVEFSLSNSEKYTKKLQDEGMKIVTLKQADHDQYFRIAIDRQWDSIFEKCPESGPKLREMLKVMNKFD
jgi:TRAP-type C4-dicarboxylate transport system substrate-binding protein